MTRLSEVGHVLFKDLREARRLLVLYLVIVAIATAHSADLGVFAGRSLDFSMVFVVLVGALLPASVVQADSPTRSDAFWATHPFRRSSMLGAKVAFALLVVAIATIGQAIGVYSYDLRGAAGSWLVLGSALLFSGMLLGVMLLSSVTRDLRSFALAAIAILLAVLVTTAAFDRDIPWIRDGRDAAQLLGLVAAVALLVWLYLTRDSRLRIRVAAGAVVALTLMSTCSKQPVGGAERQIVAPRPLAITLEPPDPGVRQRRGGPALVVRVVGVEEGTSVQLELPFVDVRLRDGSVVHAPIENPRIDVGGIWSRLALPRIAGFRSITGGRPHDERNQIQVRLTAAQRRAIATGVSSVAIDGRVRVWDSRAAETMPLVVGSKVTADGRRTRIVEWTPEDERSSIVVDAASIDASVDSAHAPMSMFAMQAFALVNESRREIAPLQRTQSAGDLDGLVLPGPPLQSERVHLGLRFGPSSDTTMLDADWLRGARLMRVTSKFLGSYPIRLESKESLGAMGASDVPAAASSPTATYSSPMMVRYGRW